MSYRFGIDVTSVPKTPAGVGNYILQLTKWLITLIGRSDDKLYVFGRSDQKAISEFIGAEFIDCGKLYTLNRLIWEQVRLPGLIKHYTIDLFHSPNYSIPLRAQCKKVCTIHDLTCFLFPRRRKVLHGLYFRKMITRSVKHADYIIAVSNNTKKDIEKICKKGPENIQTIYQGFNSRYCEKSLNRKPLGKQKPYFLFVSTIEPSKNVERLIKAFSEFVKGNDTFDLYLAGKPGWGFNKVKEKIGKPDIKKSIKYLGYQNTEQLVELYSNAFAFIYPSLYEGFGIPPLEAMASGTPVLCSNTSSLPEVVGDAALTFDPYNENEMLRAMKTITENEKERRSLIKKGYKRVALFSWEQSAKEVLLLYKRMTM